MILRKSLLPLALMIAMGAGSAFADEAMGAIKMIDMTNYTVTLEDGTVYQFKNDTDTITALQGFKVGDKVRITYGMNGEVRDAEAISGASG